MVSNRRGVPPWVFVAAAWTGPAVFAGINEIMQRRLGGGPPASVGAILFAGGDWFVYAALTPGVFAIARRWPLSRPLFSWHLWIHIAMSFVFCAAWAAAGMLLRTLLAFHWDVDGPGFVSWFFITLP